MCRAVFLCQAAQSAVICPYLPNQDCCFRSVWTSRTPFSVDGELLLELWAHCIKHVSYLLDYQILHCFMLTSKQNLNSTATGDGSTVSTRFRFILIFFPSHLSPPMLHYPQGCAVKWAARIYLCMLDVMDDCA